MYVSRFFAAAAYSNTKDNRGVHLVKPSPTIPEVIASQTERGVFKAQVKPLIVQDVQVIAVADIPSHSMKRMNFMGLAVTRSDSRRWF